MKGLLGVLRTRAHSTQLCPLEVLDLENAEQETGGQLGSGMTIHFSIEEKPFLPRGEGEADSASPASDERNSQWRSGLLSGLNPLQTMLLLTHSLLLFQGGGDSSWLIYEVLQLGVRRIWRPSYQTVIPASPGPKLQQSIPSL